MAVDGEDAPAPPLARALSDRDTNKPLERRLPCASPAAAAAASGEGEGGVWLKRTHSGARRAGESARKIRGGGGGGGLGWQNDTGANSSRRRKRNGAGEDQQQDQEGIELSDLRGLSAGKKLRLLCDDA